MSYCAEYFYLNPQNPFRTVMETLTPKSYIAGMIGAYINSIQDTKKTPDSSKDTLAINLFFSLNLVMPT